MSSSDEDMEEETEEVEFKTRSAIHLNDLFGQQEHVKDTLILDIRGKQKFEREHVKNSCNVPSPGTAGIERCEHKADVMEYFLDKLPSIIVNINVPGRYDEIIIYDEYSNDKFYCEWLIIMLDIITTWNEGTKTFIWFLNGGYQAIKKDFPHLLTSVPDMGLVTPKHNFAPVIKGFPKKPSICPGLRRASEILASFHFFMRAMDKAIEKTGENIDLQRKLRILEEIKIILKEEECKELKNTINGFTDGFKDCPSCNQTLYEIIYQCSRRHGISQSCLKKHIVCPSGEKWLPFIYRNMNLPKKCPHGVKLSGVALKRLIATALAADRSKDNVVNSSRNGVAVATRMEEEIQSVKRNIEVHTHELKVVKDRVLHEESEWNKVNDKDDNSGATGGFAEQIRTKKMIFTQAQIKLEAVTVLESGTENMGI